MRKSFNTYGSVAVWFDKNINPGIFNKGENYLWKKFELLGKECSIISEGNRVSAVLGLGSNTEKTVISAIIVDKDSIDLHSLVLKWINNVISIYVNDKYLKEVKVT